MVYARMTNSLPYDLRDSVTATAIDLCGIQGHDLDESELTYQNIQLIIYLSDPIYSYFFEEVGN